MENSCICLENELTLQRQLLRRKTEFKYIITEIVLPIFLLVNFNFLRSMKFFKNNLVRMTFKKYLSTAFSRDFYHENTIFFTFCEDLEHTSQNY